MHFGGLVMSYMLAIRFLEDYLLGDKYFRTNYPNQNLERAWYQLSAVEKLYNFQKKHSLGYTK